MAEPKYSLPRVMTVRELSAYLRVHPSTIYKLLRRGELPGFRIGTDWRFNAEVIDRWCLERNMKPGDELWEYNTGGDSWENLRGEMGYAVVRNGKVVEFEMLMMN